MNTPPIDNPVDQPSVIAMALPLIVSFVMRAAFTFVDTAYAATLGDAAVGAIGLVVPFEFLMISAWVGMSTGLTSRLSAAMGAGEADKIEQYKHVTMRFVGLNAAIFALIAGGIWVLTPHVRLEAELARNFRIYGTVIMGGSAAVSFWSVLPDSIVKAHQDTRATMWAGIVSNVTNVTLNTLFLFVFRWGIFGIALSTVVGRIGGLSYACRCAGRLEARRRATQRDVRSGLDPHPYRALLTLAIPAALTFSLMAAEGALANFVLAASPDATPAIAAYSIYHRVVFFALNPVIAFGVALLPYTARRFGQQDCAGVRRGLRDSGLVSVGYCLLVAGPALYFAAPQLAGWLAEVPRTAEYGTVALRLAPVACLIQVPFMLNRPVFEGIGRGAPGLWIAALRYLVLAAPLAFAGMHLARAHGYAQLYGLIVGLLAAAAVASALFSIWLLLALREHAPAAAAGATGATG